MFPLPTLTYTLNSNSKALNSKQSASFALLCVIPEPLFCVVCSLPWSVVQQSIFNKCIPIFISPFNLFFSLSFKFKQSSLFLRLLFEPSPLLQSTIGLPSSCKRAWLFGLNACPSKLLALLSNLTLQVLAQHNAPVDVSKRKTPCILMF